MAEIQTIDERDLLARAQSGADGFRELFDRYYDRIYAYAYRRVGTQVAAEDITACVFEHALRDIKRVRWQGKPIVAWLYRIASRRIADHYRDKDNSTVGARDWGDKAQSVDRSLERAELFVMVQSGLQRLNAKDREIIQLTYFDKASTDEIAALLECTPNNVYVRLHRALKHLRVILEEDDNGMG